MAFAIIVTFWILSLLIFIIEYLIVSLKPDVLTRNFISYERETTEEIQILRKEIRQLKMQTKNCFCNYESHYKYPQNK